jgi:PqqD family protein of HPr-rel-A system
VASKQSGGSSSARFAAVEGLQTRHFDDEAVVFDPLSWDAHLLNPAAIAVLELLQLSPRTEADVIAFLAEALQANDQPHAAAHGTRLLHDLQSLGLIRLLEVTPSASL